MARSSGPFAATPADMERARDYLAQRGIAYKGHSPRQAQRLGNNIARQEAAGFLPNRPAARGHGSTPEHPGRTVRQRYTPPPAVREAAPKAAGKSLKAGTPTQYRAVHERVPNTHEAVAGREIYGTGSEKRATDIINFLPVEGGRVDIVVTYADGTEQKLFSGADHKRNGEHAIDAQALADKLKDYNGSLDDLIGDVADESQYEESTGVGGIVSYTITFYPY